MNLLNSINGVIDKALAPIENRLIKSGYFNPLIEKALSGQLVPSVNPFDKALYRWLGDDMPVYMADDAEAYIRDGYAFNADVYAIVNYRAKLVQSIPWKLYRKKGKDSYDIIDSDPLLDLISTINFLELSAYEDLTGNAYLYAPFLEVGPNRGKATELHVLKSHIVNIVSGGWQEPVKGYRYSFDYSNEGTISKEEVLHFKSFNPNVQHGTDLYGMSPLKAAAHQVALSNSGTLASNMAFKNQGVKGVLFGKDSNDKEWTQAQAQMLEAAWQRKQGASKSGTLAFSPKELGFIPLGLSPVDLNILAGMLHNFRQLCNVFDGFPSVLLNDNENSTYNNLDAAHKAVYTNCVLPRLYRYRDGLNKWLTPRYGKDLYLDIDTSGIEVLQENKKETAEYLERAWWVKVNDKQKMLGTPEDPAMDFYMVPNNLVPVRDLSDLQPDTSIDAAMKALNHKEYNE